MLWLHLLGSLAAAGAAVAGVRAVGQDAAFAEFLFLGCLTFALSLVVRLAVTEVRSALRARERAEQLTRTSADHLAREAVREERRRLGEDIVSYLRTVLAAIAAEADGAVAADPDGAAEADSRLRAVRRIQAHAQHATGELRRHLGLLRAEEDDEPPAPTAAASPRPTRRDVVIAAGAAALATVESLVYPAIEGIPRSPGSTALTAVAASLVLWRRTAATAALAALASVYVLGAIVDRPVLGGFWTLLTFGGLLWTVSSGARPAGRLGGGRGAALGLVWLVVVALASWTRDPENAPLLAVIGLIAWSAGLLTGTARRRRATADGVAHHRAAELEAARQAAVAAERRSFAREIHDVVSHAVGLVSVQASAAQVVLADRPHLATDHLIVIVDAARSALAELDRLQPDGSGSIGPSGSRDPAGRTGRSPADVEALAARIRAAGTPVEVHLVELPEGIGGHGDVVYRIVQESLTNVVRHGAGARAVVDLRRDGDGLRVTVTDDGDPAPPGPARGYGLIGLAERVSAAGGSLVAGADPSGRGFRVEARLPLHVAGAAAQAAR